MSNHMSNLSKFKSLGELRRANNKFLRDYKQSAKYHNQEISIEVIKEIKQKNKELEYQYQINK